MNRFPTHYITDDGVRFVPDDIVRVDQERDTVRITRDDDGDYLVLNCRPATEYGTTPPLLRVGLRLLPPRPA